MDNTRTVTDAKQQKIKIKKDVITSSMSTIVDRTCYVFLNLRRTNTRLIIIFHLIIIICLLLSTCHAAAAADDDDNDGGGDNGDTI
jgi:uncharacterized membrane protein